MGRIDNKIAIVTGGAKGIGSATCRILAEEGGMVAVTDIIDDEGRQVAEEIENAGGMVKYWHLDVADENQVEKVFGDVASEFGGIDVLVNNAGIAGPSKPTHELTEEEWNRVFTINVNGVFLCTKHVIPHMRKRGSGSIVNLSSIYGIISSQDIPPYHASKGAVRLMSKTDALLYAKDNIRVNSVHPGFIWTPMVQGFAEETSGDVEGFRRQLDDKHPLGHVGEPNDIAYGVLYLASDEAKFLTGSELVIDGGYTAR